MPVLLDKQRHEYFMQLEYFQLSDYQKLHKTDLASSPFHGARLAESHLCMSLIHF